MRRALSAGIAALLTTLISAHGSAAGPEQHVLGPHLQRRLLSSQAAGREVQLVEAADLFVAARSLGDVQKALAEQHIAPIGEVRGEDGLYRLRVPLAAAGPLAASRLVSRIELAP